MVCCVDFAVRLRRFGRTHVFVGQYFIILSFLCRTTVHFSDFFETVVSVCVIVKNSTYNLYTTEMLTILLINVSVPNLTIARRLCHFSFRPCQLHLRNAL